MTSVLSDSAYLVDWLPEFWFGLVIITLGGYLLLDGFDFGIGILFAEADADDREQLLAAFGPVWKANEVWLVFFGTVLFAGFPAVYAGLLSRHYLLAFAILLALILRGLGAKLREEGEDDRWVRFWDRCFVVGSAFAPILLGMLVGSWILGTETAVAAGPVVVGLTVAVLTVTLGSVYLGLKTTGKLRRWVLHRGGTAAAVYVFLFVLTAAVIYLGYPAYQSTLLSIPTLAVILVTVGGATAVFWGSRSIYPRLASIGATAMALALVSLVAHLLFPLVDPATGLTIQEAVVSPLALNLASVVAAVFLPVILVYFLLLYSVFRGPVQPAEGYS